MFPNRLTHVIPNAVHRVCMLARHIGGIDRESISTVFLIVPSNHETGGLATKVVVEQRTQGTTEKGGCCWNLCARTAGRTESSRPLIVGASRPVQIRQSDM